MLMNKTSPNYRFFKTLDFMIGNVNMEGTIFLFYLMAIANQKHIDPSVGIPTDVFCNFIVPSFVDVYFKAHINSTLPSDKVCALYGSSKQYVPSMNALDLYADVFFIVPTVQSLMKHSDNNLQTSTYQYIFDRPSVENPPAPPPSWWRSNASPHAAEIDYLFGLEDFQRLYNISVAPSEIHLAKTMEKYWTNFAKTG